MVELDLNKVQEDIEKITQTIWKKQTEASIASENSNDETLSILLTTLARYNSSLGRNSATAKAIARDMKRVYENFKEDQKTRVSELTLKLINEGNPVGKSEHQAKVDAAKEFKPLINDAFVVYNETQLIADQADDLTYRTDTYLKMGQTRVSLIKADKR